MTQNKKYKCENCGEDTDTLLTHIEIKIYKHDSLEVCPDCCRKLSEIPFKYVNPITNKTEREE